MEFEIGLIFETLSAIVDTGWGKIYPDERFTLQPDKLSPSSVTGRARSRAGVWEPVEHSMLLENQKTTKAKYSKARIDEIIRVTNPRLFWD